MVGLVGSGFQPPDALLVIVGDGGQFVDVAGLLLHQIEDAVDALVGLASRSAARFPSACCIWATSSRLWVRASRRSSIVIGFVPV
jgi:hypothetical protein